MRMADDIFLLGGAEIDSNVYCIGNELLVDFGSGVFFPEVLDQMKRHGIKLAGIMTMVLTHSHAEHSGGASLFQQRLQAKLLVHPSAIEALKDNVSARELELDEYRPPKVDGTLKDGDSVKAGRYNFRVIYTPGHSRDSICLWEESKKILISGDTLTTGDDMDPMDPEDETALLASQRKLKLLGIEMLLPGHGSPASNANPYGRNAIKDLLSSIK